MVLAVAACAHASPSTSSDTLAETRASIAATNARFSEAMKRGDAEAVAQLFSEDGEAIPPGGKAFFSGRQGLRDYYAGRMRGTRFLDVVLTTVSVESSGDLAWETGTNRLTVQAGDAVIPDPPG